MAEEIKKVYDEIKYIRDYLVKIGQRRRTSKVKLEKYTSSTSLYQKFNDLYENLIKNIEISELKKDTVQYLSDLRLNADTVYSKILELCKEVGDSESDTCSESDNCSDSKKNTNMGKFDLKTALSLLPVLTGEESVTKQLISNIELYETMLDDSEKPILINFVLKSRLSESAKLRLCNSYDSVSDLVKDITNRLLTKQSHTALQKQLQRCKQDGKTIEEFGKELEKLFVDLTISQAAGNPANYEVLRPLNEQTAIKRFADGLRNSRISTILAARSYESLKDAIAGALDEEMSSGHPNQVMSFKASRGSTFRFSRSHDFRHQPSGRNSYFRGQSNQPARGNPNVYRNNRGRSFRNRSRFANNRTFRGPNRFNSVNVMHSTDVEEVSSSSANEPQNLFFRS